MGAFDSSNGKYTTPFSQKLLVDAFKKAGKRLDMEKCCLHFREGIMSNGTRSRTAYFAGALVVVTLASLIHARAEAVTVLCSNGLRAVLEEVAPEFERTTGHLLAIRYSVSSELKKRIDAGERFDVAILTPALVDALIAGGALAADTRTAVARSGMAVSVRRGASKPDLHTVDALKATLLAAKSIAFAKEGAGGLFFTALVQRFGLADQLAPKFKPTLTGEEVSRAVANGEAEIGIQPMSEILNVPAVEFAGPFPLAVQDYAVMVAAVAARSPQTAGGKALIQFLMSPPVDAVVRTRGMERVPGSPR
jgi:molybdate transport system substrate-binding protein